MKPDISAPGSLYSSLPNSTYQTWPGTSMAAPYMAGVIALWKESVKKQTSKKPKEGWIQAAHIALKNTARPLAYKGSDKLMWPPVKVGAGVVQAYNAVVNKVKITPTQLLVRTDVTSQLFNLSISNTGESDVTYRLTHKPGVTVNLPMTWYGDGFDDQLPVAQVAVVKKQITVPAKSKIDLGVSDGQVLIAGMHRLATHKLWCNVNLHCRSHECTRQRWQL
jgi:subtilisin family serine protease